MLQSLVATYTRNQRETRSHFEITFQVCVDVYFLTGTDCAQCSDASDLILCTSKHAEPEFGHSPGDAPGCCVFVWLLVDGYI